MGAIHLISGFLVPFRSIDLFDDHRILKIVARSDRASVFSMFFNRVIFERVWASH